MQIRPVTAERLRVERIPKKFEEFKKCVLEFDKLRDGEYDTIEFDNKDGLYRAFFYKDDRTACFVVAHPNLLDEPKYLPKYGMEIEAFPICDDLTEIHSFEEKIHRDAECLYESLIESGVVPNPLVNGYEYYRLKVNPMQ